MESKATFIKQLFKQASEHTYTKKAAVREVVENLNKCLCYKNDSGKNFTIKQVEDILKGN